MQSLINIHVYTQILLYEKFSEVLLVFILQPWL